MKVFRLGFHCTDMLQDLCCEIQRMKYSGHSLLTSWPTLRAEEEDDDVEEEEDAWRRGL